MFAKRRLVFSLATGALGLLVVGCVPAPASPVAEPPGPAADKAPSPEAAKELAPAAAPKPQPKRGGIVRYAGISPPNHLHPYPGAGAGERRVLGPVYETLLAYKAEADFDYQQDFETIPWLAESWQQVSPTIYLFHLRTGIRWHDGQEFTGADVKFSYDYARDPANSFQARRLVDDIQEIEVPDPSTVKITLLQPSVNFLQNRADFNMMVLPKHVFDRGDAFEKVAVGTGPYKLKEYDRVKAAVFARNADYWQSPKPYPDGLEVIFGLDQAAQFAAFVTKNTDLIAVGDQPQMNQLRQQAPDTQFTPLLTGQGTQWLLNVSRRPFDDARVRRAFHLGLDRQALIKTASFGDGMAQPPAIPPQKRGWAIPQEELLQLPGYRQPKGLDIAEAKRLLGEAGYAPGLKAAITYSTDHADAVRMAEPIASQLRQVDIEVSLHKVTTAELRTRERDGGYESMLTTFADMQFTKPRDYLHSKGALNGTGVADATLDRLLEGVTTRPERSARQQAALELQRHLLENVYVVPLVMIPSYAAWQPWVKDYVFQRSTATFVDMLTAARLWLDVDQMPGSRRG